MPNAPRADNPHRTDTGEQHLTELRSLTDRMDLTSWERSTIASYMIGFLAAQVTDKDWSNALAGAVAMVERDRHGRTA